MTLQNLLAADTLNISQLSFDYSDDLRAINNGQVVHGEVSNLTATKLPGQLCRAILIRP
jgi:hypothetical protein